MDNKLSGQQYIDCIISIRSMARESGYFCLNSDGDWYQARSSATQHKRQEAIVRIVEVLRKAAALGKIYNSKFTDDSFFGEGRIARSCLKRRGFLEIDLSCDLLFTLGNFWLNNGAEHPPAYSGEACFYFTDYADVPNIFQHCVGLNVIGNLKSHSSRSGLRSAMD